MNEIVEALKSITILLMGMSVNLCFVACVVISIYFKMRDKK